MGVRLPKGTTVPFLLKILVIILCCYVIQCPFVLTIPHQTPAFYVQSLCRICLAGYIVESNDKQWVKFKCMSFLSLFWIRDRLRVMFVNVVIRMLARMLTPGFTVIQRA